MSELFDTDQVDKNAEVGKARVVLPKKIGEAVITKEWDERALREVIGS